MTKIEGNKLIAESPFASEQIKLWIQKLIKKNGNADALWSRLKYHSSFDWIMPIVENINKLCHAIGSELSNQSKKQEHLSNQLDNPLHWRSWSYHHIGLSTDINDVWDKTVGFILWYNSQTRKK